MSWVHMVRIIHVPSVGGHGRWSSWNAGMGKRLSIEMLVMMHHDWVGVLHLVS